MINETHCGNDGTIFPRGETNIRSYVQHILTAKGVRPSDLRLLEGNRLHRETARVRIGQVKGTRSSHVIDVTKNTPQRAVFAFDPLRTVDAVLNRHRIRSNIESKAKCYACRLTKIYGGIHRQCLSVQSTLRGSNTPLQNPKHFQMYRRTSDAIPSPMKENVLATSGSVLEEEP